MKKGAVTLVLAMVLSLSTVGCGSSAETKQEKPQETGQEVSTENDADVLSQENTYSDIVGKEFENDDIYVKIETTERTFGINGDYTNEYKTLTTDKELTIYCDGGFEIGYIKQGATIEIELGTFNGNHSAYYRFKNPISDLPFDYIYVGSLDCDLIFESAEMEQEQQEQSDPYDVILAKVGYDKDKTYTMEEYLIILEKISNEMEKEINSELTVLLSQLFRENKRWDDFYINHYTYTYDFSDHEKMLEETKNYIYNLEFDPLGYDSIMEVYFYENEGEENQVVIIRKISNEVE